MDQACDLALDARSEPVDKAFDPTAVAVEAAVEAPAEPVDKTFDLNALAVEAAAERQQRRR